VLPSLSLLILGLVWFDFKIFAEQLDGILFRSFKFKLVYVSQMLNLSQWPIQLHACTVVCFLVMQTGPEPELQPNPGLSLAYSAINLKPCPKLTDPRPFN
jgi:hypothetical protein